MKFIIDGLFYVGLMSVGFGLLGCVIWFFESTKLGRRLADKMYDYFTKN